MVEGARLESVFTRKGNGGSNPSLSADQKPPKGGFFHFRVSQAQLERSLGMKEVDHEVIGC